MAGVDDRMIDRIYDALEEINRARRTLVVPQGDGDKVKAAIAGHFLLDVVESDMVPRGVAYVINPSAIKMLPPGNSHLDFTVEEGGVAKITHITGS